MRGFSGEYSQKRKILRMCKVFISVLLLRKTPMADLDFQEGGANFALWALHTGIAVEGDPQAGGPLYLGLMVDRSGHLDA